MSATRPVLVTFHGGDIGPWRVDRVDPIIGEDLPAAERLEVLDGDLTKPARSIWSLCGVTSNGRYASRAETDALAERQQGLGRPGATRAALIPIRKTPAWWALAQDERRHILEAQSRHIAIGLDYLPAVARRLHHSRDLGGPFDFLTWFEYAAADEPAFDELVARLRDTPEWHYIDRELDIRLVRDACRSSRLEGFEPALAIGYPMHHQV